MTDEIGGSADEAPARGFGGYERKESVMVRTWAYVMCMLAAMGLTAGVVCGVSDAAAEETNLILNRPYDYWPVPAYGGPNECTDAGDAVQLTDGVAGGAAWGSKPTVGWSAGLNIPVVVRFDLGEAATLSELRFNTVGGGGAGGDVDTAEPGSEPERAGDTLAGEPKQVGHIHPFLGCAIHGRHSLGRHQRAAEQRHRPGGVDDRS